MALGGLGEDAEVRLAGAQHPRCVARFLLADAHFQGRHLLTEADDRLVTLGRCDMTGGYDDQIAALSGGMGIGDIADARHLVQD